jgi:N-acetylmuramoyl-L-alanine amidase
VPAGKKTTASSSAAAGGGAEQGFEHVIEKGQSLSAIAKAYGTTVDAIKKANNLKGETIYIGQKLFIPKQ